MEIWISVLLIAAAMNLALGGVILALLLPGVLRRRGEDRVQAAMEEDAREEARRGRAMDEGFDNLMRYEVYGQDGFGGGQ